MDDLVKKLQLEFPKFKFKAGKRFTFRFPDVIIMGPDEPNSRLLLLHELGHAILGHRDYKTNVERLKMEVDAWEKGRELASKYGVEFNEEVMQEELDSYRDWLHKKSRCPKCGLTRFQDTNGIYHCPRCESFA